MPHKMPPYGWIPDLPDARDHLYAAPPRVLAALPPQVDLRPHCPPVFDQGPLGSCTANTIANAHGFDQQQQHARGAFVPSRLFIYYNERVMEGTVRVDAGAMIRDGIKSIAQQGVCPEPRWPYTIAKFTHKPPKPCYTDALKHQAVSYQRLVPTLPQLQGCLAAGLPFVFGFTVYASFESAEVARTGTVPMPRMREPLLGGHAVLAVGYDDALQRFLVMNSWGTGWGMQGYCTLPYAYLAAGHLADDFWTVRTVETEACRGVRRRARQGEAWAERCASWSWRAPLLPVRWGAPERRPRAGRWWKARGTPIGLCAKHTLNREGI